MGARRLPAVVVIAALLAVLLVSSASGERDERTVFGRTQPLAMPVADPIGAISSTWYCAAGTADPGRDANLTVIVANASGEPRVGSVTWVPTGGGERTAVPFEVGPDDVVTLAALDAVQAPLVSAVVEVDGGGVGVEHSITGRRGSAVAPCAAEASSTWYLANGTTERDAYQVLALFNPFPDDAIVDISFSTDEGRAQPPGLQGLPVTAGTTSFVHVHDHVRRRAVTAASIVARRGRLIVDRVQAFTGELGRTGVSLALAAPEPAGLWWFPDGLHEEGLAQSFHIYNPTDDEAVVSLEFVLAEGQAPEPLDLTLPPHSHQVLQASEIEGLPAEVAHTATVRSLNGVPVVAERAVDARRAGRRGWSSALGSPLAAEQWLFPVGEANGNTDQWLVVYNPGATDVTFSVVALAGGQLLPIEGLQDLELGPAGRIALRLGDHIQRSPLPLLLEASGDVVAERDAYGIRRSFVSTVIGIPLR